MGLREHSHRSRHRAQKKNRRLREHSPEDIKEYRAVLPRHATGVEDAIWAAQALQTLELARGTSSGTFPNGPRLAAPGTNTSLRHENRSAKYHNHANE